MRWDCCSKMGPKEPDTGMVLGEEGAKLQSEI